MRYEELKKQASEGEIKSVNRTKGEILKAKRSKGGLTASNWFMKGQTKYVITCQPSPGGKLSNMLKTKLNQKSNNGRILVTEDGGLPVTAGLRKTDPFKRLECRFKDPSCIVEKHKDCAKTGVIYEITCVSCNQSIQDTNTSRYPGHCLAPNYVGMTRTSAHWRMVSHLQGQRAKSSSNPLYRHDIERHNGEMQQYKTRILTSEKNLLPLAIIESLYIEQQYPGSSFNDRMEGGRGALVRLIATRT